MSGYDVFRLVENFFRALEEKNTEAAKNYLNMLRNEVEERIPEMLKEVW